jgi:hypothetical protein
VAARRVDLIRPTFKYRSLAWPIDPCLPEAQPMVDAVKSEFGRRQGWIGAWPGGAAPWPGFNAKDFFTAKLLHAHGVHFLRAEKFTRGGDHNADHKSVRRPLSRSSIC